MERPHAGAFRPLTIPMARRKQKPYPRPAPLGRHVRRLGVKPPALPPGTPVHTGERRTHETAIEVFNYDRERFEAFSTTAATAPGVSSVRTSGSSVR